MAEQEDPAAVAPLSHLETFVALVAHEVRTPLSIVKTGVEMLAEGDAGAAATPERKAEILAMIVRNVNLAVLLMDRLTLARDIESGSVGLAPEVLDLVGIVGQSIDDLRHAVLRSHPIEFVTDCDVEVNADPTALREIVFNLLSNAAKYSALDAPINVTVDRRDDSARMVVRNHGGGVTPGDSDHIFEKFFQADTRSSGVGLGLFVSRGLARAHGGDITVRPASHDGSEFVLELPAMAETTA